MESPLTTEGMIFITIGWGGVITLLAWSMFKILRSEKDNGASE